MGAIDPVYAKEQANSNLSRSSAVMRPAGARNQLQHSNSNILPGPHAGKLDSREPIARVVSANTLNVVLLEAGAGGGGSGLALTMGAGGGAAGNSPQHQQASAKKAADQPKVRNNSSFHLKAKRFLSISSHNGLKPSASTSCLNLEQPSQQEAPLASPTRASLTHDWKKLKTPNKCRECNLIVYFNGRECSFCGFIAHKKCVTVLVIKCSGSLAAGELRAAPADRKSPAHRCLSAAHCHSDPATGLLHLDYLKPRQQPSPPPDNNTGSNNNFKKQDQQQQQPLSPKRGKPSPIQPIFGQPVDTESRQVVDFLRRFVYEIDTRGLTSKGIYRVSSIKSKVDRLCTYYDQNLSSLVDLSSFHPNIIANALKMYLRQLPEPLLTAKLYNRFIDVAKKYASSSSSSSSSESEQQQQQQQQQQPPNPYRPKKTHAFSTVVQDDYALINPNYNPLLVVELREVIELLPPINRELVAVLMRHLKRVADMSSENQMSAKNLSIIFGPTLMSDNNKSLAIVDNIHQARVVELMITWANQIFPQYDNYESRAYIDLDLPPEVALKRQSQARALSDDRFLATAPGALQPTLLVTSDQTTDHTTDDVNTYELKLNPLNAQKTRRDLQEMRKQFFDESHPPPTTPISKPSTSETCRRPQSPILVAAPAGSGQLQRRASPAGLTGLCSPVLPTIKVQPYCHPNRDTHRGSLDK